MSTTTKKNPAAKKAAAPRPEGAPAPQDHKPKQDDTPTGQAGAIRVASLRGRDWTVAETAMDDFEILDDIAALNRGDVMRMPSVLRRLLGDAQFAEAMDSIRDKDTGRVSVEAGVTFATELMGALNPNS